MPHTINKRIYYEDTDAGGVVYYANYLKYTEAARTEYLREHNIDIARYHEKGFFFVVSHAEITYRKSAALGDLLSISTTLKQMKRASLILTHEIRREDGTLMTEVQITLAFIDNTGKPRRLPEELAALA